MNQSPILTTVLGFLLFLAVVALIVWTARFLISASRRKRLELSKLAHEVEALKHELGSQK